MHFNHLSIPAMAGLAILAWPLSRAEAAQAPTVADSYEHIYKENVFDPKRAQWAIAAPPAPALPPPSASDIQLYGIVSIGTVKRAVFKVAPSLAGASKRQFVTLSEGQSLGSYQIAEIKPDQVVLAAGEARYPMQFAVKTDRSPAGIPLAPASQSAMVLPAATPTAVPGITPAPTPPAVASAAPEGVAGAIGAAQATANAQSPQAKPAEAPQPTQQAAAPVQGNSLLEAIQAAWRAQQQGNYTPPPNPFAK